MKARLIGIGVGLLLAGLILWRQDKGGHPVTPGPLISECDGHLSRVVIQYIAGAEPVIPVYQDFLTKLDANVQVIAAVPGKADWDELSAKLGPLAGRLQPVMVGHLISSWSRDRWLLLEPSKESVYPRLLCAANEDGVSQWPQRAGDATIAYDLARQVPHVSADRSTLGFDGGDFLCDGERIFVAERMLSRNIPTEAPTPEALMDRLKKDLGRPVVLLRGVPSHHVAMYMAAAKRGVMVVGDPAWGKQLLDQSSQAAKDRAKGLPQGADLSQKMIDACNAAAQQAADAGCKVVRIPVIPGGDGRAYITYTNVVIDGINPNAPSREMPRPVVYMPVYDDMDELNAAATKTWEGLGYEVRPINCTSVYHLGGVIHCLVNVIDRK